MEGLRIATLADVERIEQVPLKERMQTFNTYDLIKNGAAVNPEAPALSFLLNGDLYESPMTVNYAEFMAQIHRTANMFHDLGVGTGDVVSYLLPNIPHTHYVLWGGEAVGIVNPINPLLEADTIKDICLAAKTKVLVALGEVPGSDIWKKVSAIRRELPDLQALVRVMGGTEEAEGIYGFDEVIAKYNGDKLNSGRQIAPDDVASMYHTGGTTGTPKLAPHTHFNEAAMTQMLLMAADINPGETMLCGLPLFHVNGTTVTGALPFSAGAHVVLLSPQGYRDPTIMKNFYKIVAKYKAVAFSSVPTVLSVLLDMPKGDADISSLRYAICGAAPLSVELFRRFEAHTGMKIMEGYGLTEGTTGSSFNPLHGERKIGSIGLRLPYQEMKSFIVDDDGKFLRDAETDEIGCICIKGPNVFKGYLEEDHNKGIWAKESWFNTGDLGRQDKDGYYWLTGRKKELIIRGGHNIDPATVEEPLYRLPGVQVAAAVGRPDAHAGETPVAYVQLQEGADLNSEKIMHYLKEQVGERAALPKEVIILDQIPLTPVGKIFKPALRWDAIKRVYESELRGLGDMISSLDVKVKEDKVHGALAVIEVKPGQGVTGDQITQAIADLLAKYTVRYTVRLD